MPTVEPLGLTANQWQFLSDPAKYVAASANEDRQLNLESTWRQFLTARDILARLNGSHHQVARGGVLLADDVGLGKTTVAALIAWVVASAGGAKRKVRILAPNDVMVRRWGDELRSHVPMLESRAPSLGAKRKQIKLGRVTRLPAGSIQVVKHSYASADLNLKCDLLIVDEAHRAKGEGTAFSEALKRQKKFAKRVLILTATPFSIRLEELHRMLTLVGGGQAYGAVKKFSETLDDLYQGNSARSAKLVAEKLIANALAAVDALGDYVIRHSVDDLPSELNAFGQGEEWPIPVLAASPQEIELMLRMDRLMRLAQKDKAMLTSATNDPRFHVGWRHFDAARAGIRQDLSQFSQPTQAIICQYLKSMALLRSQLRVHPKMSAVVDAVAKTIGGGEKVVLFCHHHATAQELTTHLGHLPPISLSNVPAPALWQRVWETLLLDLSEQHHDGDALRCTFIEWLCSDMIRAQTWSWLDTRSSSVPGLKKALLNTKARHQLGRDSIVEAANHLYRAMLQSDSSSAVLRAASTDGLDHIAGGRGLSRVLGLCEASSDEREAHLFNPNQQPDTALAIFNSPFGPDILVVTDKLSEGVDLHRYCRHLIHYELNPSPIRTVQRNGRIRRVNSWAAVTQQPLCYAYPAFAGTRDFRLVQIMKQRMDRFALLLGGVHDFDAEQVTEGDENWRSEVVSLVQKQLRAAGRSLCAKDPREN